MNIIKVESLTKIYKQRVKPPGFLASLKTFFHDDTVYKTAVDEVSFEVESGDIVGLLGPNGAGKTTVLKILSGILYPTSGNVEVAGYIPCLRDDDFKKTISLIVGQKNQMIWDLPAMDTLLWLKEIYDIEKKQFFNTLDNLVNIFQAEDLLNLQVRRMSLGQRMKMELIAAMIHNPQVVFLDEPTIGLDVRAQNKFRDFIKEYNKQTGATVILTSHNLADVEALCEKVILINNGRITHNQTLNELIDIYDYKFITLKGVREEYKSLAFPLGVSICSAKGTELILRTPKKTCQEVIKFIWSSITFDDIKVEDVSIQEIIERAFGEENIK